MKRLQKIIGLLLVIVLFSTTVMAFASEVSGEGASLTIATKYNRTNLSPFRTTSDNVYPDILMVYERPMYLTAEGEYVPWLLKNYSATDGYNYDFEIYDNIYDSEGNHITADDIVWNINKNIEVAMKPDFTKVASVEKTGDYTVHIELTQDRVYLFESLMWNINVVSQSAFEASADEMATNPITTSPYKVTNFVPSATLTLEKRDDYWQKDESLIPSGKNAIAQKVTYNTVAELSQRVIAVETGVADVAFDIEGSAIDPYQDNKDYIIHTVPDMEGKTLYFSGHESRAIANDLNLRLAICYAIDPAALIMGVAFGHGEAMVDTCSPVGAGFIEKWNTEEYFVHNVDTAKEYLAKSNYKGEEIEMLTYSGYQRIGEIIQSSCLEAGIKVKLIIVDGASLGQYRTDGSAWDMILYNYTTPSLAYNWSLCFDSNAFPNGDAMNRKDNELTDLIYKTWVNGGYNDENIDAVHRYVMDHAYARGLYLSDSFNIVRADSKISTDSVCYLGTLAPWTFTITE